MLLESTTNHGGLVINAPTSKQKHVRFQDNGSLKWQIRMPSHMANPDSLRFYSYTANADVMTLLNDGTVGIGTTSPGTKLEVVGGNWNTSLTIKGGASTSGIKFLDSDNNVDGYIYAAGGTLSLLDSGGDYMINILNDDSIRFAVGASEKMRILNSGNIFGS